jgi:integrase
MSVHKGSRANGKAVYIVRWREGARNRRRTFDRRRDAELWDAEVRRRRQLGALRTLDAGRETLNEYVADTFVPTNVATLARATREHYVSTYDLHIAPHLGSVPLRDVTPEAIAHFQAARLRAGAGPVAIRRALELLGTILQRATESQRISSNPARLVRRARLPHAEEVRPFSPVEVESMRTYLAEGGSEHPLRDATLVAILAYAGLRPGEALALRWGDVRDNTLLIQRSASYGEAKSTKTGATRSVRLLAPLRQDLAAWRLASGRPERDALVFPSDSGGIWSKPAYQSWRRRAFARAVSSAGIESARVYDLRHSFASLLLHEGRSVIDVARQLGHDARLTLTRYGHVIDELDAQPRLSAEDAIRSARAPSVPLSFLDAADG